MQALPINLNSATFGTGATELVELTDISWTDLITDGCLDVEAGDLIAFEVVDPTTCPGSGFRFKAVKLDPATVSTL